MADDQIQNMVSALSSTGGGTPTVPPSLVAHVLGGLGKQISGLFTYPREAMEQGTTSEQAVPWGVNTALMMGMTPGVPEGALGALKLVPRDLFIPLKESDHPLARYDEEFRAHNPETKSFYIHNDANQPVGAAWIERKAEEGYPVEAYVHAIGGLDPVTGAMASWKSWKPNTINKFGLKEIRSLLGSVKEHFPDADVVSGERATGAKDVWEGPSWTSVPLPKK